MYQKLIRRLSFSVFLALLSAADAAGKEVSLPHQGITLNANLAIAPGKRLSDGVIVITHGTQAHNKLELIEGLQQRFMDQGRSTLAINLSLGLDNRRGLYDCSVPSTYRHADAIDEIGTWVDWLKTQGVKDIVLMGHSRGANQISWFAAEQNQDVVKSLVLLAPGVSTDESEAQAYRKRFDTPLEPVLTKAQALDEAGQGQTLIEHIPFLFICRDTAVTAESLVSHYGHDPRRDTRFWLPKLKTPTLVLIAGADEVAPGSDERFSPLADGKRIQMVIIEGSGHFFRDLNSDDAVDAAIAFFDAAE
jgi:pimeloyl-ACP methyl ester carboxylesterase